MAHHQLIQNHIVHVEQEGGDGRGHPHPEDGPNAFPLGHASFEGEGNHRVPPHPGQHDHKEKKGHAVGKAGSQSGSQHLITVRHQHEHEQGVQGDIQKPAHDDTGAGLPGAADAADQVSQYIGEHRGDAADHNNAGGVLPGVLERIFPGSQKSQDRFHENRNPHRKQRRNDQPQVQGKRAGPFGLFLLALAQQPGD